METPSVSLHPIRRNGFQASCEACRKAKARCDHQEPCSRCTRQGKDCVFKSSPGSVVRPTKRPVISSEHQQAGTISRKPSETTPNPLSLHTGGFLSQSHRPAGFPTGYMGPTGFGGVLQENKFASLWEDSPSVGISEPSSRSRTADTFRDLGTTILAWLPEQSIYLKIINHVQEDFFCLCFFGQYAPSRLLDDFWQEFGPLLSAPPQSAAHNRASETITAATKEHLPIPSSNADWLQSISGPRTRWELIGELFVGIGAAAFAMPVHDPLYAQIIPQGSSKTAFAGSMLECAEACRTISLEISTQTNILHVILLNHMVTLQSMLGRFLSPFASSIPFARCEVRG